MKFLSKFSNINCNNIFLAQQKKYCSSYIKDNNRHTVHLHKPGDNHLTDGYIVTDKTTDLLQEHLKFTGGQVRTRFAPSPNGQLHLGHAKAININFGYAQSNNGICFLRFDDTNPEEANETNCRGIIESVKWLGCQPYKITYTSDYFDVLYEKAVELIKLNLAFVCHEPPKERWTTATKEASLPSRWCNRPIEESLQEFTNMQNGTYKQSEACLRMKHKNADQSLDPVAYRIKASPHFRTGAKWRVYPTYEFSHCISDSIENITHSLCSSEFYTKKLSYYWLCNALSIYCPVQIEFGRLNILNTVVSKRKIISLVEAGVLSGWDDIRLYTLAALQKRGMSASVINSFSSQFGTRLDNSFIDAYEIDIISRKHLMHTAKKFMCILNPIKVVIENFPCDDTIKVQIPFYTDKTKGSYEIPFGKNICIDSSDFQEIPSKTFLRLTEGQSVGLKYASYVITLKEIVKNSDGSINTLKVTGRSLKDGKKPKIYIHWLYDHIPCEVHQAKSLLHTGRNSQIILLKDVNLDSLTTVQAIVDRNVQNCEKGEVFQFERVGYFCMDDLSTKENLIFNRTCDLKQSLGFRQS